MKKPELSFEQRAWLKNKPVFPEWLTIEPKENKGEMKYKILERSTSGEVASVANRMGYKGFVLKVQDVDTDAVYAAKICIPEDYDTHRTEIDEARLANILRPAGDVFAIPHGSGRVKRFANMPGPQDEFVCFISDWVEGETLESRCQKDPASIDAEFICSVTIELVRAIQYLRRKKLKHDDLHWGNVMLMQRDPDLALTEADKNLLTVAIIDMGSLKPLAQETAKSKDDDLSLVSIMISLYNIAWSCRATAAACPVFLKKFREIIQQLSDEDHLRYFPQEDALPKALIALKEDLSRAYSISFERTFEPFEAISAEHLADDATLLELFENSLPWFKNVMGSKPIVLTGPRGCGKSMLFRYMAVKTHLGAGDEQKDLDDVRFFGVYISCATHLQNNLIWIPRKKGRAAELAQYISTFFQLIVLRELLRSLAAAFSNEKARAAYGLVESGFDELVASINHYFPESIETPRLTSKLRISHFADDVDRRRVQLHIDLLNQRTPTTLLTDTFIGDITAKICQTFPRFIKTPIVFLLDDYTENRLHADIQSILNRIIFERRGSHFFKVSCEKYGFSPIDIDGVRIDPEREYEEVDAGCYAAENLSHPQSKKFLSGLMEKRLKAAKWKGRIATLIGDSKPYSDDVKLARYIREEGSTQGKHYYYYGMDHLARLWSGDIATILQIVKEMFVLGAVTSDTTELIPKHIQHQAITTVSKAFKERVNGYYPNGPLMAEILNNFGSMSKEILVNGKMDGSNNPRRYYRLEMTKSEPLSILEILKTRNEGAAQLAKEILRRAIFIQLPDSRGKEGVGTQTVRWELRKIFLPAFGLSLTRESYIDVKQAEDFIHFLVDSASFCASHKAKYILGKNQDRLTGNLFGDEE